MYLYASAARGSLERFFAGPRKVYAQTLFFEDGATLDDLREAVTTLEDVERIARRVFGGTHPEVVKIKRSLQSARAILCTRELLPPPSPSESV